MFGRNRKPRYITGLDIGTTKVCAIIARADADNNLEILGFGSCPSRGLQRGEITEIQSTVDAIVRANNLAQEMAQVHVDEVYVGIAGEHIRSENRKVNVDIRHPTRGIDEKDRQRAIQKAVDFKPPENQTLIHSLVQDFCVNGRSGISNPVGLSGSNLEVHTHLVLTCVDALNNIVRCVRGARLGQPRIVLQSLASSLSVLNPPELELGTVLIDIGGGTTDVAVSMKGSICATCEIAVGGDRITQDIAKVLSCSSSDAENVKKRLGSAMPEMVERGRTFQLPHAGDFEQLLTHEETLLAEIIEARLEEIFVEVARFLNKGRFRGQLHAGAVLTGGTALLQGITDVAERILETKCRLGKPHNLKSFNSVVSSPIYSTGVGLILYGMQPEEEQIAPPQSGMRRILDYLVDAFM